MVASIQMKPHEATLLAIALKQWCESQEQVAGRPLMFTTDHTGQESEYERCLLTHMEIEELYRKLETKALDMPTKLQTPNER